MVQVCASSIEKAQVVRAHPLMANPGVLVGKQTYLALSPEDRLSLCHCTSQNWPEELVASHFRSIFMPTHGHSGLLYRVGEFALVRFDSSIGQTVIRITDIFVARLQGVCFNCIKGEIHPYKLNESDETETHPYSGSSLVVPSADHLTVLAVDLLRKVMMYPEPENFEDPGHYIVIDYLRQEIPLRSEDVIIPFFPEKEDMALVQGDAREEPWRGHIQSVDVRNKTCQLHFYVESHTRSRC